MQASVLVASLSGPVAFLFAGDTADGDQNRRTLSTGGPACDELVLDRYTVSFEVLFEACHTLRVGRGFSVVGPSGFLRLRSGHVVVLENGFSVDQNGRLEVGTDPSLLPSGP